MSATQCCLLHKVPPLPPTQGEETVALGLTPDVYAFMPLNIVGWGQGMRAPVAGGPATGSTAPVPIMGAGAEAAPDQVPLVPSW